MTQRWCSSRLRRRGRARIGIGVDSPQAATATDLTAVGSASPEEQRVEEPQVWLFEFKDLDVSVENPDGKSVGVPPLSADDGSTLKRIARAVANQGGSSANTTSRSRNRSSVRIAVSQGNSNIGFEPNQLGLSESQSATSSLHTLLASFATAGAAAAFLKDSGDAMVDWQQGRPERCITFKHKGATIILKGRGDIEKLAGVLQRSQG